MAVSGFFVRDLRSWGLVRMGGLVLSSIILLLLQLVLNFIRKDSQYALQVFWITFSWLSIRFQPRSGWFISIAIQCMVFFMVTLVLVLG